MRRILAISTFAVMAATTAANAVGHSYAAFNPAPAATTTTWRNTALGTGAPNGTYVGYSVLVDWVGGNTGTSGQWSNETRMSFCSVGVTANTATTPTCGGTNYTTVVRAPQNTTANNFNVSNLRFRGGLSSNYVQSGANTLAFNFRQTFAGSNAMWSNVRVSLYTTIDEALGVTDLGTLSPGLTSQTDLYSRAESLRWYKFTLASPVSATDFLSIDTNGNTLTGGSFGAGDTYVALYNSAGNVVSSNDDHTNGGAQVTSLMIAGSQAASSYPAATGHGNAGATLAAGSYYVAVGPYNINSPLSFGPGWNVSGAISQLTTGVDLTGSHKISLRTNTPEPATLALIAFGALALARRRR